MRFLKFSVFVSTFFISFALTTPTWALSMEQRVDRLERIANNPVLLQQSQKIETQQKEIQALQDVIDRLEQQIKQLEKKQEIQHQDTDQRINALIKAQENSAKEEVALIPPLPEPAKTKDLGNVRERYDEAFVLLRESKYDASIVAFKAFVTDFPNETLTSNGYYWLGESYLIKQDYQNAFDAFNFVIENLKDSNKIDDSMLRGADSLVGLNKLDDAKKMYQDLIKRFPTSNAAKSAERRLEKL